MKVAKSAVTTMRSPSVVMMNCEPLWVTLRRLLVIVEVVRLVHSMPSAED